MKDKFFLDLIDLPTSFLVSKWLTERVPFIFEENNEEYIIWKEDLSKRLNIDSKAIVFTGSSCCGFSLNPSPGSCLHESWIILYKILTIPKSYRSKQQRLSFENPGKTCFPIPLRDTR